MHKRKNIFNLLLASGKFCCMLMKFSNSWDPDQARRSVRPDLDPSYLALIIFPVMLKISAENKKKLPIMQRV